MGEQHRGRAPPEGRLAREALEEDAAEGVDVCPAVDRAAGDSLRRDVGDRPQRARAAGHGGALVETPRQAEVREVGVVGAVRRLRRRDQDVGRLHVAMHEPARMGGVERAGDLREQRHGLPRIERPFGKPLREARPLHVAHGDEQPSVGLSRLVHRDDVRVVEACSQLRLTQVALAKSRVPGEVRSEQLRRHFPPQAEILGEVDDAHAAASEHRPDPVAGEVRASRGSVAH